MHREQFDSIVRQVESIFGAKSSEHLIEDNWRVWRNKPVEQFLDAQIEVVKEFKMRSNKNA